MRIDKDYRRHFDEPANDLSIEETTSDRLKKYISAGILLPEEVIRIERILRSRNP
jgi:hypothetical protein